VKVERQQEEEEIQEDKKKKKKKKNKKVSREDQELKEVQQTFKELGIVPITQTKEEIR